MRGIPWFLLLLCETAAAQTSPFTDRLYPILKNAGCPNCHNSNGVASGMCLIFPTHPRQPSEWKPSDVPWSGWWTGIIRQNRCC